MTAEGTGSSPWRRRWGWRVFGDPRFVRLALGVVIAIVLAYRVVQIVDWLSAPQWGYDFSAYWLAARHLLGGEPIYSAAQLAGPYAPQGQFLYLYPPLLAVLAIPFAVLSPDTYGPAAGLWALGGGLVSIVVVLGIARLEGLAPTPGRAALLLGGAFAFPPLVGELVLGNVHLVLLGLLALAWWGVRIGGRRGDALAGLAIGTAALTKLFPALVVLWLALTGRWRAAGWAVLGAGVLVVATLPITGLDTWLRYPTVLLNLGAPADTTDALAPAVWLGIFLPSGLARAIVLVVGLAAVAWAAVRLDERASFGTAVAVSVLVAPALFQHYLAIMVLPLLLGLPPALGGPNGARVALAASYFAMWPGQQPLLGGAAWVLNRALPTLGALGLPATLLRWSLPRRPAE